MMVLYGRPDFPAEKCLFCYGIRYIWASEHRQIAWCIICWSARLLPHGEVARA